MVVANFVSLTGAAVVAEARRVPLVVAHTNAFFLRTGEYPPAPFALLAHALRFLTLGLGRRWANATAWTALEMVRVFV